MSRRLCRVATPLGNAVLALDGETLLALDWDEHRERMGRLWGRRFGGELPAEGEAVGAAVNAVHAYFAGDASALDGLEVDPGGTEFQAAVWKALRGIPPGRTTTYGALAETLDRPDAVRAVGAANGANPVSLVLPCHRVVGADGELVGYAGGLERKRWLLRHEGVAVPEQASLFG